VSFGGRGRSNILLSNVESVAGDHDFHIVNFTPSVCLHVDIKPEEGQDMISYYKGKSPVFLIIRYFFMLLPVTYLLICFKVRHTSD
jgi:hypothetical protein